MRSKARTTAPGQLPWNRSEGELALNLRCNNFPLRMSARVKMRSCVSLIQTQRMVCRVCFLWMAPRNDSHLHRLSAFFGFACRHQGEAVGRIPIACSALFILSAVSASGADFPARKAGLWEMTITGDHSLTVRQCSDAASDEAVAQAGFGWAGECAKRDVEKSGSTITVVSVCTSDRKTTTSRIVITGSLDSDYTMTVSRSVGPSMTVSAKRLGPCAAGQKPGDVIMPNGNKINIVPKGTNSAAR